MTDSLQQLDRRITRVEQEISDHIARCAQNWDMTQHEFRALKQRINWLIGLLIAGMGAIIIQLIDRAT